MLTMTHQPDDAVEVLRAVWGAGAMSSEEVDEAFGPQKACKNMKHVSFDGMAEPGSDLRCFAGHQACGS